VSEEANLDAYLKRINYAGSIAPNLATLEMLHRLHPAAIPFENLNPLMELPVRLQLSDLEQKLVVERRGGYCFEHNLLFKAVLEAMDFTVTGLAAGVLWGRTDPSPPQQLTHMALLVDVGGVPYLADVGFGGQVMTAPLRLRDGVEQETPNGRYRLSGGDPVWVLEAEIADSWRPLYRFDLTPRRLDDYVALNDVTMGMFKDMLMAARSEGHRRHALLNTRYNLHDEATTTTRTLGSVAELRDVLSGPFGITLPETDKLDTALARVLAGADA
jgi:N-hydroxyarylamine O-acetyltransferase